MPHEEIQFEKYKTRGADYHWKEIDTGDFINFNAYLYARYQIVFDKVKHIPRLADREDTILKIVDFGCGDGVQLHLLNAALQNNERKLELSGVDLSEEAIRYATKKNPDCHFTTASVYETGLPDNTFDIALSSDVIEHLQHPGKMVDEMVRTVKMGGHIIVATPLRFTERPLDTMHVQEFFENDFKALFERRSDISVLDYEQSNHLASFLLYIGTIRIFGRPVRFFWYLMNFFALFFGKNVFLRRKRDDKDIMSYQYIVAKKN